MTGGSTTLPPITRVVGGAAGLAAVHAAVRSLADRFDTAGDRMRGWAASGGRTLRDPDLLASAPLSPVTFAEAEERVLAATVGTHGVLTASLLYESDALLVRATVDALEACDRLVAASFEALDYTAGRALGCGVATLAPYALAVGSVAVPAVRHAWPHLPSTTRARVRREATDESDLAQEWADHHPQEVQHLVDGSGGLLDGLLAGLPLGVPALAGLAPFHPTVGDASADLAGLYAPEGPPRVRRRHDLTVRLGTVAPRDLTGLVRHLGETDALSPHDRPGDQGTIEVQTLTAADGTVRHIVYLPGTDDLATLPWTQDGDVRDLATNLLLIHGQDNAYLDGILAAMHEAGVGPDDPVLLAGHSQGGMEAAAILGQQHAFNVTNVVTAGSPTAQVPGFPPGTHVLSLENRGDVVPLLDGGGNPDTVEQVTVHFDDRGGDMGDCHGLAHYANGAAAVDASRDPSVREQLRSLRDNGFLGAGGRGGTVTSQVFQVTRHP
jgi:hypothetical protein